MPNARRKKREGSGTAELAVPRLAPHPKAIVLTTFDADEYVLAALQAGASGFLLKDVSRRSLAEAVRQVHEGVTMLAPAITLRLVERHVGQLLAKTGSRDRVQLVIFGLQTGVAVP